MIRHADSCPAAMPLLWRHEMWWRTMVVNVAEVAPLDEMALTGAAAPIIGDSPLYDGARPSIEARGRLIDSPTLGGSSTRCAGPRMWATLAA